MSERNFFFILTVVMALNDALVSLAKKGSRRGEKFNHGHQRHLKALVQCLFTTVSQRGKRFIE